MAFPVKFFDSTMQSHPMITGQVGTAASLLKQCLITGWGSVSVASINVQANVATVATTVNHGFNLCGGTGGLGPVIKITGATPTALNDEWRVLTTDGLTGFTFETTGIADCVATGTITVMRAPLGWQNPFSGTNKEVFKPKIGYCQQFLRVLDDTTVPTSAAGRWANMVGYETMTGIDDLSGQRFPTTVQYSALQLFKSDYSDSTERQWWLVGDGGIFYLGIAASSSSSFYKGFSVVSFGDINSLRSGDEYSCFISGLESISASSYPGQANFFSTLGSYNNTQSGKYLARSYTQVGTSVRAGMLGDIAFSTIMGGGGLMYPNPSNNGFLFSQVGIVESNTVRSRAMPGMYQPLHNVPLVHLDTLFDFPDFPDKVFRIYNTADSSSNPGSQCLIEIKGPWR